MRKRRKVVFYFVIGFILVITFFAVRRKDLTIHIIAETSAPNKLLQLQMDNKIIFEGEVNSGVYFGERIVLKNKGFGFYSLKLEAVDDKVVFHKDGLLLLNRTMIITYYDTTSQRETAYFDMWWKFGNFLPD